MKYLIIILLFIGNVLFAQDSSVKTRHGIWDGVIISIEKQDTTFVVTGQNMIDDTTPSGLYFEWYANAPAIRELCLGMKIVFDRWKPKEGYWLYKDITVSRK